MLFISQIQKLKFRGSNKGTKKTQLTRGRAWAGLQASFNLEWELWLTAFTAFSAKLLNYSFVCF